MKTIIIPKRFGYPTMDLFINGKKYVFDTGVEIEVDDRIATIIENAIELEPKEDGNSEENNLATIAKVLSQTYFRGWFDTNAELIESVATPNDYAYSMESGTVWDYSDELGWVDSGKSIPVLTGTEEKTKCLQNQISLNTQALFQNGLKYTQDITQEYNSRATADGANILDGSSAILKKVEGGTVAVDGKLYNASFGGVGITGVNLFNPNRTEQYFGGSDSNSIRSFTPNSLYVGLGASNLYYPNIGYKIKSWSYENGKISLEVKVGGPGFGIGFNFDCRGNERYCVQFNATEYGICEAAFYNNGERISSVRVNNKGYITTPENCNQFVLVFRTDIEDKLVYFSDIQVQIGTTATAYVPYADPSVFAFPKTETPLGRTIDFENKKIVDYGVEIVLDGTEAWGTYPYNGADNPPSPYAIILPTWEANNQNAVTTDSSLGSGTGQILIGHGSHNLWWIRAFEYLGLDSSWADKVNPTQDELRTAITNFKAYLAGRYESGNPVTIRYKASEMQSETPFTDDQVSAGNAYSVRTGGMEVVQGNDGAEYGAENTLTQNYIMIKEST
jgi:hypothetical protein